MRFMIFILLASMAAHAEAPTPARARASANEVNAHLEASPITREQTAEQLAAAALEGSVGIGVLFHSLYEMNNEVFEREAEAQALRELDPSHGARPGYIYAQNKATAAAAELADASRKIADIDYMLESNLHLPNAMGGIAPAETYALGLQELSALDRKFYSEERAKLMQKIPELRLSQAMYAKAVSETAPLILARKAEILADLQRHMVGASAQIVYKKAIDRVANHAFLVFAGLGLALDAGMRLDYAANGKNPGPVPLITYGPRPLESTPNFSSIPQSGQ